MTRQLLWKLLSSCQQKTFPFSPQASGHHRISFHRFLKDRVSILGNVVEALTLWNQCTRQRAVSWNASFWFLFQDISLFTVAFNALQSITFSVLPEQCSNAALWETRYNFLSGMHTSKKQFLWNLLPRFYPNISPVSPQDWMCSECPFTNPSMTQFQNCVIEGKFFSCEMNRGIYHKAVSQKASFQFLSEDTAFFNVAIHILADVPW